MEWFLNNKQKINLKGFENHFWNGLTTNAFGEIIYTLIKHNIKIPNTIHIVPKDVVNKYDLLQMFNEKYNMKFKLKNLKLKLKLIELLIQFTLKSSNKYGVHLFLNHNQN